MEWECRNIDSCLHCPFPDCIQPFEFKYPSERKHIIYKTRVEAMNIKTGAENNLGMGKKCMCDYCAVHDFEWHSKRNVPWRVRQGLVLSGHVLCIFRAGKRRYKSGDKGVGKR